MLRFFYEKCKKVKWGHSPDNPGAGQALEARDKEEENTCLAPKEKLGAKL
jgi:hypothetical protein